MAIDEFSEYVDQLDEPEVLSEEWIENKKWQAYDPDARTLYWAVTETDLENLLVPKQELPVIPKYVADWITEHNIVFDLYPALKKLEDKPSAWKPWKRIYEWYRVNTHQFVNAYLTGEYKVEEEQKYYVINNDQRMMLVRMMDGKTITEADPFKLEDMHEVEKKSHRLTEQEIKDYDTRYFAFAVPVEEVE